MAVKEMERLGKVLDAESYEWLASMHSEILEAVEAEVSAGSTPDQIRYFVLLRTGRPELAIRCQAAARHARVVVE